MSDETSESGLSQPSLGLPSDNTATEPFVPKPPESFQEAGLDPAVVETLIVKYLAAASAATGTRIVREICLPRDPVIKLLQALKKQQIVYYADSTSVGDFKYALTEAGRDRAQRYMFESMYVGSAPVPLDVYLKAVSAQTITTKNPKREDLERAFSDLLISKEMFDTLGPAINSGRGMFLYGYPGNGKSSIAERVTACFGDTIYIPRCLIVDGLIIKLFDESKHEAIEEPGDQRLRKNTYDTRWVKIRRPTIIVGGELTLEALEFQYNATSKMCEAPAQMKSNCGTFVVDDFGRQRVKPVDLLNRWIVPLEKRFDYLTLPNGRVIMIPFDQLIIFATNLEPRELCDEAFLRRIPYKIQAMDPTEEQFRKLFELMGPSLGFEMDDGAGAAIDHLVEMHFKKENRPFRCCQPRDLMMQVRNWCLYQDQPMKLTPEYFDYAVSVYFTVM